MKIRNGFVSNSSSSSFVAVCVNDKNIIEKFLEIFEYTEEQISEAEYEGHEDFAYFDHAIVKHVPTGLHIHTTDGQIYWIGIEITDLLQKDLKVSECKEILVNVLADVKIKVTPKKIEFRTGECYSG